jgi:hypothetical protein
VGGPPGPAFLRDNPRACQSGKPARGPAADQGADQGGRPGVRPTTFPTTFYCPAGIVSIIG